MSDHLSPADRKVLDDFNRDFDKTMRKARFRSRVGDFIAHLIVYTLSAGFLTLIVAGVIRLARAILS